MNRPSLHTAICLMAALCFAAPPLRAQPEASVRVAAETAPPGGLALIQIELTEPAPILVGDITVGKRGAVLGGLCGIGLFSASLDVVGVGTRMGDETRVRFLGFSGDIGVTEDLPVMVVAFDVEPSAALGAQGSLEILESTVRLEAPNGTVYRNDIKQGVFTVGGISITQVTPSSGIIPAGTQIRFQGVGFNAESRIDIDGIELASVQVLGPNEIVAVAGQTFRIENRRIRLRNRDGDEDFFYAFAPAKLAPESGNLFLRLAISILSPNAVTQATLAASSDLLGLSIRNGNAAATDVRVRAFDSAGALLAERTVSLAAETLSTLTPAEWLDGADLSAAAIYAINAAQPVQALGLRFEDGAFSPVVLSDDPPPVPTAPPAPAISSGGWVMATLLPSQNGIAPLAITTLFGVGFAPEGFSASVEAADIVDGRLPTSLGGVCVEIDGERAPLFFVSSKQVNLQALGRDAGVASAVVVRGCGTAEESRSAPETVAASPRLPAWFVLNDDASGVNPIAALHGGGPAVAADPSEVPGATAAAPGEAVSLFATGLGRTDPLVPPGAIPQLVLPGELPRVAGETTVRVGGRTIPPEDVLYVGAAPCCAGLYQVVVRLPADLPPGPQPVEITVDGFASLAGPYLTIRGQ